MVDLWVVINAFSQQVATPLFQNGALYILKSTRGARSLQSRRQEHMVFVSL